MKATFCRLGDAPSGNNRNKPSATLGLGGRPLEVLVVSNVVADKYGLQVGTPALSSAGAITFGPEGILFVADNAAATIFAIHVGDDATSAEPVEVAALDTRVGSLLGVAREDVRIAGMAVHPGSQAVYLSVARGRGASEVPVLVRVTNGELAVAELADVPFAQVRLDDAPGADDDRQDIVLNRSDADSETLEIRGVTLTLTRVKLRASTITDLAWVDGTLLVAGASNEEFSSTLRAIPFPFGAAMQSSSLEIFHVSHGKYETASPIRTFIPFDGNTSVLASYTCTPVVHFPLTDLQPGAQLRGRTVAELGAMNQPLDMIAYRHDGAEYLLVCNTRHPLLKIPAVAIDGQEPLTSPTEPVGVPREELDHAGVRLMANLGADQVLMLQREATGDLALHTYSTASL
jgi:hypothetical protein